MMPLAQARIDRYMQLLQWRRAGWTLKEIGSIQRVGHQRISLLLDEAEAWEAQRQRRYDRFVMARRRGLGRPIDMGGRRGVWLEFKLGDGQP